MTASHTIPTRKLLSTLPWLAAWSPALLILALLVPLLVPVPFEDSWAFVQQYRDWCEGRYGTRELFAPHNNHPTVPGKLIYFAVLHFAGGDVALLPLVGWVLSLGIAAAVFAIARPHWRENPVHGAVLMFCVNLTVFSAAAGHSWIWDFVFLNFIAGACFAGGLALLSVHPSNWKRMTGAALFALTATFAFGSGFLGGVLLTAMVWTGSDGRPMRTRILICAGWLVFVLGAAWLALKGFGNATSTGGDGSRVGFLLGEPLLLAKFILMLLGYALGNGTSVDPMDLCPLMGLGVLLIFIACAVRLVQRRGDTLLLGAALPWILVALYGLGNAALIAYGRMRFSLISAMAPRYVVFTLFFTLGTLVLVFVLAKHEPASGRLRKAMQKLAWPLLGMFLAAQAVNWAWGHQQMRRDHERMRQESALLGFVNVLPADANTLWQLLADKDAVGNLSKFLRERDRLRGVSPASDDRLASIRRLPELSSKWAWFEAPVLHDGIIRLHGVCGLSKDLVSLPDAIVITAQTAGGEERIVAMARPEIPFDFYEHEWLRRLHLEHYFGWSREVSTALLPKGRITLRAYALDAAAKRVRAMAGVHELDL